MVVGSWLGLICLSKAAVRLSVASDRTCPAHSDSIGFFLTILSGLYCNFKKGV